MGRFRDLIAALKGVVAKAEGAWDESEHPRVPAGSEEGGEFTSGGGGGGGAAGGEAEPKLIQPKDPQDRVTQARLEREWESARPEIERLSKEVVGQAAPAGPAGSWDNISADDQIKVEESWKDNERTSVEESESESLSEFERENLKEDADWNHKTSLEILKQFPQEYDNEDGTPIAIVRIDSDAIDEDGKVNPAAIEWADEPKDDPRQTELLPRTDEERRASLDAWRRAKWEEHEVTFTKFHKDEHETAFDKEMERRVDDMDISNQVNETLDELWESTTDEQKFEFAKEMLDLAGASSEETVIAPDEFRVLSDGINYDRTARMGRAIMHARASELIKDLKERGMISGIAAGVIEDLERDIWSEWVGSSTRPGALALQLTAERELGALGRLNPELTEIALGWIKKKFGNVVEGGRIMRAYVRAQWETSQWLMEQAGMKSIPVYRAIMLSAEDVGVDYVAYHQTEAKQLPEVKVLRNGASSWTANPTVANNWGGVGTKPSQPVRVVLRAEAPRTAVLSLPVFGDNQHNEEEVVLVGTPLGKWDAWFKTAPMIGAERGDIMQQPIAARVLEIDLNDVEDAQGRHWLSGIRASVPVGKRHDDPAEMQDRRVLEEPNFPGSGPRFKPRMPSMKTLVEKWEEAEHPRAPAGSAEGGEFTSAGGAFEGAAKTMHERSIPGLSKPMTGKEAGNLIVENLLSQKEREGVQRDLSDEKQRAKMARNWAKDLKGRMDTRQDFRDAVAEGMEFNKTSPRFMAAVNKYAGNAVIVALPPKGDSSNQAEHQGVTLFYQTAFNREQDVPEMRARMNVVPAPDDPIIADGSFAGTIRHEYGHRVATAWMSEDLAAHYAWRQAHPDSDMNDPEDPIAVRSKEFRSLLDKADVTHQISYYANEKWEERRNDSEAFAEAFALWSHPRLDRGKFSPETNRVFEFFDRQFGTKGNP